MLTPKFFPRARRDLEEQAEFFLENASLEVAQRFLLAAERTADQIAQNPQIGQKWESLGEATRGLRFWKVSGFPRLLVFYRVHEPTIEIVRVLHSARDLSSLI